MNKEKIKTYNECNDDEKEVIDSFRKMKLLYDHARYKLHKHNVEELIGEFTYIVNKPANNIYNSMFKIYRKLKDVKKW